MAIIQKGRRESTFIDPNNLDAEPFVWEGRWRNLDPVDHASQNLARL